MVVSRRKSRLRPTKCPGRVSSASLVPLTEGSRQASGSSGLNLVRRALTELRRGQEADAIMRTKLLADQDIALLANLPCYIRRSLYPVSRTNAPPTIGTAGHMLSLNAPRTHRNSYHSQ